MCTLVVLGSMTNRKSSNINILCIAGFIILIFRPLDIKELGFILSFLSVLGIFLFYKPLYNYFMALFSNKKSKGFLAPILSIPAISLSAQWAVLSVSLYIFHFFSVGFIVSNLLTTHIIFVLIILCFILVFLPFDFGYLDMATNYVIQDILLPLTTWLNSFMPIVSDIYFDGFDFLMWILIFLSSILFLSSKYRFKGIMICGLLVLALISKGLISNFGTESSQKLLFISNYKNNITILHKRNDTVQDLYTEFAIKEMEISPWLKSQKINFYLKKSKPLKSEDCLYFSNKNLEIVKIEKKGDEITILFQKKKYMLKRNNFLEIKL